MAQVVLEAPVDVTTDEVARGNREAVERAISLDLLPVGEGSELRGTLASRRGEEAGPGATGIELEFPRRAMPGVQASHRDGRVVKVVAGRGVGVGQVRHPRLDLHPGEPLLARAKDRHTQLVYETEA